MHAIPVSAMIRSVAIGAIITLHYTSFHIDMTAFSSEFMREKGEKKLVLVIIPGLSDRGEVVGHGWSGWPAEEL